MNLYYFCDFSFWGLLWAPLERLGRFLGLVALRLPHPFIAWRELVQTDLRRA